MPDIISPALKQADDPCDLGRFHHSRLTDTRLRHNEVLSRQPDRADGGNITESVLLVGSRRYVRRDDRILVLHWRYDLQ